MWINLSENFKSEISRTILTSYPTTKIDALTPSFPPHPLTVCGKVVQDGVVWSALANSVWSVHCTLLSLVVPGQEQAAIVSIHLKELALLRRTVQPRGTPTRNLGCAPNSIPSFTAFTPFSYFRILFFGWLIFAFAGDSINGRKVCGGDGS